MAGLWDGWQGAGSLLNIRIPNELSIKNENINIKLEDNPGHYSIYEIYGIDDIWEEGKFEYG